MVKALIAVRAGSERVKNKNIRPFAGKSLLEYKILQLKRLSCLDGIVVNSNDETMLNLAASMGCETVRRDEKYASSSIPATDFYVNIAENLPNAGKDDVIVSITVTSPLVADQTIEKAVSLYLQSDGKYESVNAVNLVKEFLYLHNRPLNYDPLQQTRSQDLPDIYALNYAVNVISRENMIRYKNIISPKHLFLSVTEEEAVDIDTEFDFEVAELLFRKRNGLELR